MAIIKKILSRIKNLYRDYDRAQRASSTQMLEWEKTELEHIFAVVLFGFMVGYPSAPTHIMLDLLPVMGGELDILLDRVDTANDPLAELFSMLDIG